jgi:hypothetical protein
MTISTPARLLGNAVMRACFYERPRATNSMRAARSVVPRPCAPRAESPVWHTPDKELLINRRAVQSFDHFGVWHSRIMGIMPRDGAVIDGRDQICTSLSATPTWTLGAAGPRGRRCDIFHIHFCTSHASLSAPTPHVLRVSTRRRRSHYWKTGSNAFQRVDSAWWELYFYTLWQVKWFNFLV